MSFTAMQKPKTIVFNGLFYENWTITFECNWMKYLVRSKSGYVSSSSAVLKKMFTTAVFVIFICSVLGCEEPRRCYGTSSLPNTRLLGQTFKVQKTDSTRDCIDICDQQIQCRSVNFNWVNFLCELNKVDVHVAPQKLFPNKGYVYLDNPWPRIQLVSCKKV